MAYNKNQIGNVDAKTGGTIGSEDFGIIRRLLVGADQFEFATETDAQTLSNWLDHITGATSPQVFPFPLVTNQENNSEDPIIEDVSRLEKIYIAQGLVMLDLRLVGTTALGVYQQLQKFNGKNPYVAMAMEGGQLRAWSSDGTKFTAIPTAQFNMKYMEPTATTKQHVLVTIGVNPKYFQDEGVWTEPSAFDPVEDLFGVKMVDLTLVSASTSEIIFKVDGAFDSEPITGDAEDGDLAQADFTLDSTLDGETDTITNNLDGTFTITPTATFTAGSRTIDLKAPSVTGQRYAQRAQLAVTVS